MVESFVGRGDHRSLGRGMGLAFHDTINRIVGEMRVAEKLTPASVGRLHAMEERVGRAYPHLLEEMAGIAEGAGLDYLHVLAYNMLTSVQWACTNVAFRDGESGPIIGKTNDIGEDRAYYHVAAHLQFPSGASILHFTWPGTVWSNAGINGHGIAQAGASVDTESVDCRGLESNLLQRAILEGSSCLEDAVEIGMSYPAKNHAINLTLADGENVVVLEKGVGESALRFPRGGAIFATNHWITPRMAQVCRGSSAEFEQNTRARWANLERLVAESRGDHSVARMKQILSDHSDRGAICQHGPFMHTSVAYVLEPGARRAEFAFGRPCQAEFRRFTMQ
jgi:isopenicillin-N N-acyltransferase like protein